MRSKTFLTSCLLSAALLGLVPSCASKGPTPQVFPPAEDLRVKPKPQLAPEALGSEAALDAHDTAVEVWGEEGWLTVARICRWAVGNGATLPFDCPAP